MTEGEQGETDKTTQTGTPPANGGSGSSGQSGQGGSQDDPSLLKLTSAQLSERLDRAKNTAVSELLKQLGFEKPEDLKTTVDQFKAAQDAQKTELQKAQDALTKAQADAKAAQERAAALEEQRIADKLNRAISDAAQGGDEYGTKTLRAFSSEDVITWIRSQSGASADELAKLIDESGKVDAKKVGELVKACQKARPHYFQAAGPGSPSNRGGKAAEADPNKILGDKPLVRF